MLKYYYVLHFCDLLGHCKRDIMVNLNFTYVGGNGLILWQWNVRRLATVTVRMMSDKETR